MFIEKQKPRECMDECLILYVTRYFQSVHNFQSRLEAWDKVQGYKIEQTTWRCFSFMSKERILYHPIFKPAHSIIQHLQFRLHTGGKEGHTWVKSCLSDGKISPSDNPDNRSHGTPHQGLQLSPDKMPIQHFSTWNKKDLCILDESRGGNLLKPFTKNPSTWEQPMWSECGDRTALAPSIHQYELRSIALDG